jgi:hypothetical protein
LNEAALRPDASDRDSRPILLVERGDAVLFRSARDSGAKPG